MSEWNSFEFVVDEKPEGMRKLGKHLGSIGLLGVVAVFVILCFALNLPALAVIPLLMLGVILYFWKMFNVELAYSIDAGVMTFSRIRGGNNDKKKIILLNDSNYISEIADSPGKETYLANLSERSAMWKADRVEDVLGSSTASSSVPVGGCAIRQDKC